MIGFKLVDRSIGLVSTVVLARLLVPADFGLVAMATSIIAALALLGAFNFDLALIQNPQAEPRHFDTVWTLDVAFGLVSALALLVLALPAASFYREPRLSWVMIALALGVFLGGLQNVGVVNFRKELNFDREFRFLLGPRLVGFIITMICAFTWRNYWALVAGIVSTRLAGLVVSYAVHPYRPRFSLAALGELLHFSKWLFVNNLLYFINSKSSDFIIGRIAGTHALGIYGLASEVSSLPTTELSAPIQRAVFPGYAAMAGDLSLLRKGFLDVLSGSALFVIPAAVGIVMVADPVVRVLLGPNWLESIPLIQILAFSGLASALSGNTGYLHMAMGRPRVLTLIAGTSAMILLPTLIIVTSRFGIVGAAWAALAVGSAGVIPMYVTLLRSLRLAPLQLLLVVWRPLTAAAIMAAILHAIEAAWPPLGGSLGDLPLLVLLVAAGVFSYAAIVLTLWWLCSCPHGAESFVLNRARNLLSRTRNPP